MGGKVEKTILKYFDTAKMRGKVGTLIRDEMNRLHAALQEYIKGKIFHFSFPPGAPVLDGGPLAS